jgi:hypothetical protein
LYGLEGEYIASARFSIIVSERVIRSDDINVTDEDRSVVEAMVTAEAQRQAAEALRVAAEAERVANEQKRQEASGTILAKAEEVAVLRERAANASDLAVEASTVAIASADTATTNAQMASGSASEAEHSAREAKASEEIAKSIAFGSVNMDARISRTNKLITNLVQGVTTIPVETDDSVAYAKVVPSNVLPYAEVIKVGGMTRKCTNLLNIADLTVWTNKVVNSDGSLSVTTGTSPLTMVKEKTGEIPSGTYTFSNLAGGLAYVQMGEGDYTHPVAVGKSITFTYDGVSYLRFIYVDQEANTTVKYKVMFNEGSTALPHEPYFEGIRDSKVTEIKSLGANLTTAQTVYSGARSYAEMVVDGRNCVRMTSGAKHQISPFPFKVNTQYTVSFDSKCEDFDGASGPNCVFAFYYSDGTQDILYAPRSDTDWTHYTFTSAVGKTVEQIGVHAAQYQIYNYIDIDTFMLNEGATALPYVPYAKHTLPIPSEIQSLDGYGLGIDLEHYNYIDWERKVYVQKVAPIADKTLQSTGYYYDNVVYFALLKADTVDENNRGTHILASEFTANPADGNWGDASHVGQVFGASTISQYWVGFAPNTTVTEAQAIVNDSVILVALANPIETDISHILSDDNMIEVEGGGTVTFENEHQFAVPSSITYMLKGAK